MQKTAPLLVTSLFALLALSGCFGGDDGGDDEAPSDDDHEEPRDGDGDPGDGNTTEDEDRVAALGADPQNGTAPVNVTFSLTSNGTLDNGTWTLVYGDGAQTAGNGTELPLEVIHEYVIGGNFTANFTVTYGDGETHSDTANITIETPEAGEGDLPQTTFEYGQTMGCASDANAINPAVPPNCISFHLGPTQPIIDGQWQALDQRYWGLTAFVTITGTHQVGQDSDCYFVDADLEIISTGHNAGGPCTGEVPEETAFMYLYPWAEPATTMILEFS